MIPERTADTMSLAIEMTSPSGSTSKRALKAAQERLRIELFGVEGLPTPTVKQPTEYESLMRQAAYLRDYASKGLHPRAYKKQAEQLEARAALLKST